MKKIKKNCLRDWKTILRKLNAIKTGICRRDITLFISIHPFISMLSVYISDYLTSTLQTYLMAYSELCQTSKMELFARIAIRKKSSPVENQ